MSPWLLTVLQPHPPCRGAQRWERSALGAVGSKKQDGKWCWLATLCFASFQRFEITIKNWGKKFILKCRACHENVGHGAILGWDSPVHIGEWSRVASPLGGNEPGSPASVTHSSPPSSFAPPGPKPVPGEIRLSAPRPAASTAPSWALGELCKHVTGSCSQEACDRRGYTNTQPASSTWPACSVPRAFAPGKWARWCPPWR